MMLKNFFGKRDTSKIKELEERVKVLETVVFALKENVKMEKRSAEFAKKKKWLNSYPDEPKEGTS
jgi:hypothetical protein